MRADKESGDTTEVVYPWSVSEGLPSFGRTLLRRGVSFKQALAEFVLACVSTRALCEGEPGAS
jgi:hypothetical protein